VKDFRFNPLAQAAHNDASAHGYSAAPDARNGERKRALRDARDLLRRAELLATGARQDPQLAWDIANFLPHIATLV
jgi:hypothetical protein